MRREEFQRYDFRAAFEQAKQLDRQVLAHLEQNTALVQKSAELIEEARALMAEVDRLLLKKVGMSPGR